MLLNKHKNAVYVGLTALGLAVTVGMATIGTTVTFFGDNSTITANRFSTYGLINAKTITNPSSNGLKSENITIEFEDTETSKRSVNDNGFVSLGYALKDANEKEPSIFNVHGVSEWKSGNVEFLFESLSPTDYESKVFYQAHTPFTRLANFSGFSDVKYLSTVGDNGARHVVIETTSSDDMVAVNDADDLWRQMLIVLSPMSENTSYDLTLNLPDDVTVHGTLSTKEEQEVMMESAGSWESVFALHNYAGVQTTDLYLQGKDSHDDTVAVTILQPESTPNYIKNLTSYASNRANKFPRNFTTTVTVENEATPAHVFYPER